MHLLDYINSTGRAERAIGDVNIPAFDEENPVGGRHLSRADRNITQTCTQIHHCKIVHLTRRLSLDALGRKQKVEASTGNRLYATSNQHFYYCNTCGQFIRYLDESFSAIEACHYCTAVSIPILYV